MYSLHLFVTGGVPFLCLKYNTRVIAFILFFSYRFFFLWGHFVGGILFGRAFMFFSQFMFRNESMIFLSHLLFFSFLWKRKLVSVKSYLLRRINCFLKGGDILWFFFPSCGLGYQISTYCNGLKDTRYDRRWCKWWVLNAKSFSTQRHGDKLESEGLLVSPGLKILDIFLLIVLRKRESDLFVGYIINVLM